MCTSALSWDELRSAPVATLVVAAQKGERAALGELFERYRPMVMAVIQRRLHDPSDAQELTQEVFIQAIQKLHQLRTVECFGGWLRSIANRMAINHLLRNRRSTSADPYVLESAFVERQTPYGAAVQTERAREVRSAVERLRRMDRDTLEAFYIKGQSLSEMSVEFDAPIGTIKRRLHVARQRLAEEVEHLVSA